MDSRGSPQASTPDPRETTGPESTTETVGRGSALADRLATVLHGLDERPELAAWVEEARRIDAQLLELHRALEGARTVDGYAVARDLAIARDALCARIGLAIVRSEAAVLPVAEPATAEAEEVPDAPPSEGVEDEPTVDESSAEPQADAAPPAPEVASASDISDFLARNSKIGTGAGLSRVHAEPPAWSSTLEALLEEVGAPESESVTADEVAALANACSEEAIARWLALPSQTQRAFISMVVARAAALRESDLTTEDTERLRDIVIFVQTFTKEHRTGHINGLARRHVPLTASWSDDARRYWRELRAAIDFSAPPAEESSRPRRPPGDANAPEREPRSIIPADWPFWTFVRGKQIVLVGGEPREVSRARLEDTLGASRLEWVSSKNPRRHDALVSAIAGRRVDVVLIVKTLMSHSIQEKIIAACEDHDVVFALIDGYGAAAIVRGLEQRLRGRTRAFGVALRGE